MNTKRNKKYCWVVKAVYETGAVVYNIETEEERRLVWEDFGYIRTRSWHKLKTGEKLRVKSNGKFYTKNRFIPKVIIVIIILAAMGAGLVHIVQNNQADTDSNGNNQYTEIYIEKDEIDKPNETPGQTQLILNPTIEVKKQTMQNIGFKNANKGKSQKLKIKLAKAKEGEYIFESPKIEYSKNLIAGVLKENLAKGDYAALGEVYTYNSEGKQVNQTNFNLTLVVY